MSSTSVPIRLIEGGHLGLRRNLDRTLAMCEGTVIALSDQDDVWMPGKVRAIRAAFESSDVTMWFSDAVLVDEQDEDTGRRLWKIVTLPAESVAALERGQSLIRLLHGQTVTGATMAFRASLREVVCPLPAQLEHGGHLYLHDGWIAIFASLLGRVKADPIPYTRYRQHPLQVTYQPLQEIVQNPAPSTRFVLAGRQALRVERDRVALVLDRLEQTGFLARCRSADVATLRGLRDLLNARTLSAGPSKWAAVIRQLAAGRYSLYARGWRTAAADLFAVRQP